jgi:hypothetical protein
VLGFEWRLWSRRRVRWGRPVFVLARERRERGDGEGKGGVYSVRPVTRHTGSKNNTPLRLRSRTIPSSKHIQLKQLPNLPHRKLQRRLMSRHPRISNHAIESPTLLNNFLNCLLYTSFRRDIHLYVLKLSLIFLL